MAMKVVALVLSFVISILIERGRTNDLPSDICSIVAGRHFKQFRGDSYEYYPNQCLYTLAESELTDSHSFEILLDNQNSDEVAIIYIGIEDSEVAVEIRMTPVGVFLNGSTTPANLPLMLPQASVVKRGFYYILTDSSEIKIEYAVGERIYLFVPESIISETYGLCKIEEGSSFTSVADLSKHRTATATEFCEGNGRGVAPFPSTASELKCKSIVLSDCGLNEDHEFFKKLCSIEMNATPRNHSIDNGICLALAEYYRICALCDQTSVFEDWRNEHGCVVSCPNSEVFAESGSLCPMTCDKTYLTRTCSEEGGFDGCHCRSDHYWNEDIGVCVPKAGCFCVHEGHHHETGETVDIECNTCTCAGGSWACTRNEALCEATCSITGKYLTLFNTFDGTIFENTDSCGHLLVEPKATNGTFQLSFGHHCAFAFPCLPYLTLVTSIGGTKVTLRFLEDRSVLKNNDNMKLPLFLDGVVVRNIVDNYLLINTNFGITIMWDWKSDLEITAADSLRGGSCGHLLVEPKATNGTFQLSFGHHCPFASPCLPYLTLVTSIGGTKVTLR
eukprot:XP_011674222.1 PREDICTED: mucin-5B-like [Strongylocentrotus purpuratus]